MGEYRYQVVLVDDDQLARLALREFIRLTSLPIEIIGEANDGYEAIQLMESLTYVDIVITDLKMPRMDGTSFIRKCMQHSIEHQPIFIVLSAYEEHQYVREAFVIGAFDYMLKAKLDEHYILPILQRCITEIQVRNGSQKRHTIGVPHSIQVTELLQRYYLNPKKGELDEEGFSLVHEDIDMIKEHFSNRNIEVAVIRCSKAIQFEESKRVIKEMMKSSALKYRNDVTLYACCHDERHFVLVFSFQHRRSALEVRQTTNAILTEILSKFREYMSIQASIGVSDILNGIEQISQLLNQAMLMAEQSFYSNYNRIFYPELVTYKKKTKQGADYTWQQIKQTILASLQVKETNWHEKHIYGLNILPDLYPLNPAPIKSHLNELIWDANELLDKQAQLPFRSRLQETLEAVQQQDTWEQLQKAVQCYLKDVYYQLHPLLASDVYWLSPAVAEAKRQLEAHYMEDIQLSQISRMVGVSESYLSKLFLKELGINYISYLTKLRIEKAKKALEQGYKINEIAESIGYSNPEHFSRIFKKVTGLSPMSYKKKKEYVSIDLSHQK